MSKIWKVVGINFDHMHMGDLLRQTYEHPFHAPIPYVLHCLVNDLPIEGPLDPQIARIGQFVVDAAVQSANRKTTVRLAD